MSYLYQHQKDIIKDDPKKKGLFLGTGTGKTRVALELAQKRTLVVCPKTQRDDQNWEREVFKAKLAKNITVISKEDFRRDWDKLPAFHTLILDEAHAFCGVTPDTRQRKGVVIPKTSQIFEATMAYINKHRPERVYLCTATISKSPMTIWGASQMIGYTDVNGSKWDFFSFRERFYTRIRVGYREIWIPKSDKQSKDLLASLVHKLGYVGRLEDYFDVPDQTHKVIHTELTTAQKKRIKDMSLEYPDPIVRIGKIHQIENGILSGDEFSAAEYFDNEKIEKILDISEEYPRIIVFAKYTAQIEMLTKALKKAGKKVLTMTGATDNRGDVIKEAGVSPECIFVVQAQLSSGWELPDYPCMVFASRTYSFVDFDQSLGRIQRATNIKKNLYIYLVVRGHTDEAVHKCLESKKDFNEKIYART